jgi:hypothetical protein
MILSLSHLSAVTAASYESSPGGRNQSTARCVRCADNSTTVMKDANNTPAYNFQLSTHDDGSYPELST